jgi:chromosome segregation ATPase
VENEQMTGTQFRPLIERTQHLLGGLAQLLDEHDEMQAEARRAAEERESLRREIQELQRDNENLRNRGEALWREHQALLEERNDLLRERETLLSERERISAGLSKFMREVVQPMNAPRSAVNG